MSHQGRSGGLTLDWNAGFSLTESAESTTIWNFKFSQLRGSSDDGKSKLKLHFQDVETRAIETKVSLSDVKLFCYFIFFLYFSPCLHRSSNAKHFRAYCSACTHSWQQKSPRSIRNFSTPFSKLEIELSFHFKMIACESTTAVCIA